MPQMQANGITIEYGTLGAENGEPLLLIMGLGAQMTRWPDALCGQLVRHGFRVIRFDNRDVGLSTHCKDAGVPDAREVLKAKAAGQTPDVPYTLDDMAADAVAVLDGVGVEKAHIVGASMGGMIAQLVAADYPDRVLSLTSIFSTTGNPDLPPATPEALAVITTPAPHPSDEEAFVAHSIKNARVIGSPAYPLDEAYLRERAVTDAARAYDPAASGRQYAAVLANGDRRPKLAKITAPTVVLHGADDPLVPVTGGRDTAANIQGAELRVVPGMGHDLPVPLYDKVVDAIISARDRARRAAATAGVAAE
jgi:pimeloyl-ACP methyl ester carboxylesterase